MAKSSASLLMPFRIVSVVTELILPVMLVGEPSASDEIASEGITVSAAPSFELAKGMVVPPTSAAERPRIFVNFDGAELRKTEAFTEDDAPNDTSWLFGGTFERYGDDTTAAAILQAVRRDFSAYDIEITDTRPSSGPYTMALVTPTNPVGGGVIGYAPVDCWNAVSASNIIFAFHGPDDGFSTAARGTTVSQEVAHSFGLEHSDDEADVMHPIVGSGRNPTFTDTCAPVVGDTFCSEQHATLCGNEGQNAHQELLVMFGPAEPDTEPPAGTLTEPEDGSMLPEGEPIDVRVEAEDDNAVASVILFDGGEPIGEQKVAPYTWTLREPARGTHELYALLVDHAGHESLTEITLIGVGGPPAAQASADLPGLPGGPPLRRGDDEAAGCRVGGAPAPLWLVMLLAAIARGTSRARREQPSAHGRRTDPQGPAAHPRDDAAGLRH